jgi:hypothetical protein
VAEDLGDISARKESGSMHVKRNNEDLNEPLVEKSLKKKNTV